MVKYILKKDIVHKKRVKHGLSKFRKSADMKKDRYIEVCTFPKGQIFEVPEGVKKTLNFKIEIGDPKWFDKVEDKPVKNTKKTKKTKKTVKKK